MKVLHVSGPSTGGIGRHIDQLQMGLAAKGIESTVAPPVRTGLSSVVAVIRELRREKYDLVHCHGFQGGAAGRAAAIMAGVPVIVTIHNTLQVGGVAGKCARLAELVLRQRTSCWVAVSAFLRNYAWTVLKVPDTKTEVIANGVDVPKAIPPWSTRPVVGIVARLIPSKGVDVFLKAVQLLRPEIPELSALVIGDGPAKYELKNLSRNLGLENTVTFMGHCDDVPSQLRQMGVFVLPTRSEGLGISVLEAMAMGVPVVATAVGGVPELIKHGHTGILVRVNEYSSIARAVRGILRDKAQAERLRHAAFEHAASNYHSSLMLERTFNLYRRVVHD